MSFKSTKELYQALIDGKKIRQSNWSKGKFVSIYNDGNLVNYFNEVRVYSFTYPSEWEVYEPPKKKVKMYKYIIAMGGNDFIEAVEDGFKGAQFYKNDEDFKKKYKPQECIIFMKKENDFIEVEE